MSATNTAMSAATAQDLWLGLDTGGTFTDAVLLVGGREVAASAKALTTPWNLAIGISKAIRTVLEPTDYRSFETTAFCLNYWFGLTYCPTSHRQTAQDAKDASSRRAVRTL